MTAERITVDRQLYSRYRLQGLSDMMHELGFIHCDINPEGFHRMEKKLDYKYFTVTVSLVYYSNELAVWIDDNKPMLFCGHVPHGIKTQTDLDEFVDELVLDAIKLD